MRFFEFKNEDAAGVGIVTKQNATADVPVGGEYMNVKKLFPKKKKKKESKTIKVDHTAVMDSANAGYVLVQDRKCIARGTKEDMLKLHEETPHSRVWVSTAEIGQLVESVSDKSFQHLMREYIAEGWSEKYKRSINCNNPKGFSQKAHCAGRKKNEDIDTTMDLNKALDTLEPRLKDVVLMRVKYEMTFKEIGKEIGTGTDRAHQVYQRALRMLRHPKRGITSR